MSNRNETSTKANATQKARRIARRIAYANLPESVRRDMAKEVNMIQYGYKSTIDAAFEDAHNQACDALDLMRAQYGKQLTLAALEAESYVFFNAQPFETVHDIVWWDEDSEFESLDDDFARLLARANAVNTTAGDAAHLVVITEKENRDVDH